MASTPGWVSRPPRTSAASSPPSTETRHSPPPTPTTMSLNPTTTQTRTLATHTRGRPARPRLWWQLCGTSGLSRVQSPRQRMQMLILFRHRCPRMTMTLRRLRRRRTREKRRTKRKRRGGRVGQSQMPMLPLPANDPRHLQATVKADRNAASALPQRQQLALRTAQDLQTLSPRPRLVPAKVLLLRKEMLLQLLWLRKEVLLPIPWQRLWCRTGPSTGCSRGCRTWRGGTTASGVNASLSSSPPCRCCWARP
mmetsp:Transcript_50208/g.104785  ORF Transcript_50208/g.104785 Transcript_50208/m.104785 type:complete len:252 (+) Transcript_50208:88-843(+)